MLRRLFERLLLHPADLTPSRADLEIIGVFNPAAIQVGKEVVLLVRVAERPREKRAGFTALPRWTAESGVVFDWVADEEHELHDPRAAKHRVHRLIRLTFISHLRVIRCGDGRSVASTTGAIFGPQSDLEEYGVEDPRLTFLDGRYYFTYVAVSRHGVATALASTLDFQTFARHGIIFCPENKDVVLFPQRLQGDWVALHRPVPAAAFTRPEMWIARSPDLLHWGRHAHLLGGCQKWESGRIGPGTPPLPTPEGWLEIYHGSKHPQNQGEIGVYSAGALLLDAEQPSRILKRTAGAIFGPTRDYEHNGFVPGVVFPTGIVDRGETLLVYYGAADSCTAVVEFSRGIDGGAGLTRLSRNVERALLPV